MYLYCSELYSVKKKKRYMFFLIGELEIEVQNIFYNNKSKYFNINIF